MVYISNGEQWLSGKGDMGVVALQAVAAVGWLRGPALRQQLLLVGRWVQAGAAADPLPAPPAPQQQQQGGGGGRRNRRRGGGGGGRPRSRRSPAPGGYRRAAGPGPAASRLPARRRRAAAPPGAPSPAAPRGAGLSLQPGQRGGPTPARGRGGRRARLRGEGAPRPGDAVPAARGGNRRLQPLWEPLAGAAPGIRCGSSAGTFLPQLVRMSR